VPATVSARTLAVVPAINGSCTITVNGKAVEARPSKGEGWTLWAAPCAAGVNRVTVTAATAGGRPVPAALYARLFYRPQRTRVVITHARVTPRDLLDLPCPMQALGETFTYEVR
jgi:hypothetical protein